MEDIKVRKDSKGNDRYRANVPGGKTFGTRAEAETWLSRRRRNTGDGYSAFGRHITLADMLDSYTGPQHGLELFLESLAQSDLAPLNPTDITPALLLEKFNVEIQEAISKRPRVLPGILEALKLVWSYAKEERGFDIPNNPVKALNIAKMKLPDRRITPSDEITIFTAIDNTRNDYIRAATILTLDTGMFEHELLELRWSDIDFTNRVIRYEDRVIPLSVGTTKMLLNRIPTGNFVFPGLKQNTLQSCFLRLKRKYNDISDITFDNLRIEAIYRMFERGMTLEQVRSIVGHKTDDTLLRIQGNVRKNQ